MHMRTREECGLGLHVLLYIECTTFRARAANKRYLNLILLRFLQDTWPVKATAIKSNSAKLDECEYYLLRGFWHQSLRPDSWG